MAHPLENYRIIAKSDFIVQVEEKFYTTYHDELISGLYVDTERENDRMKVMGVDLDGNSFGGYTTLSSYLLKEYYQIENETRSKIDDAVFSILDEAKQKVFITNIIAELQVLRNAVTKLSVDPKHYAYKSILLDKVTSFSSLLQDIYQSKKQETKSSIPKIQWLEATNLLTTLFYDLLNGQKKTKKGAMNTKPFIKAKNTDIEKLIIDNFLDSDGKPFSPSTIKTYLNNSRPETRVQETGRIELEF